MAADFTPNEGQRRAIEFPVDRPLKVIAGAGTGKTAVLTHRFVHIVEKYGIPPSRIIALTFTRKAAAEMRGRIVEELLRKKLMSRSEAPMQLWIGNFHSVCLKLLRQYSLVAGLDPSFRALGEADRDLIISDVVMDFLDNRLGSASDSAGFERLMVDRVDGFEENTIHLIDRLDAALIEPGAMERTLREDIEEQYRIIEGTLEDAIRDDSIHANTRKKAERRLQSLPQEEAYELLVLEAAGVILEAYDRRKEELGALDFNDLVSCACRLAESERSVKRRFDYILVDEFQDTDGAQLRRLQALSENLENVTVVCDKKQCIYEWREVRIENIDDFPGETIFMDENYRSFGEILDSANFFIAKSMPEEKPLRPAIVGGRGRSGQPRTRLYRAADGHEEADFIAGEISRLVESGQCEPGDIAILMRSVLAAGLVEDALRSCKIPHTVVGGRGFHDLSEIKDLMALVRLIENPFDDLSMARVLKSPAVGISDASLYSLRRQSKGDGIGLYDALLADPDMLDDFGESLRRRVTGLLEMIETVSERKWSMTIGEIISEALAGTGYLKYLASVEGTRGQRFSNVSSLYKMATRFEEGHAGATPGEFLAYAERTVAAEAPQGIAGAGQNLTRIMTVHQAKGLEFPVVFVANLGMGAFPLAFRSDAFGYDERFGVYAGKLPAGKHLVRYEGGYGVDIEETLRARHMDEENRIMYVAMTRAEKLLYLSTPKPEVGDEFFSSIEAFAEGSGSPAAEIIDTCATPSKKIGGKADAPVSIFEDEIIKAASHAVARIDRDPQQAAGARQDRVVLSYSRLALLRECPKKYAMRHIYRFPLAPHEEEQEEVHEHIDAFTLGNLLHTTLMRFHRTQRSGGAADALDIFGALSGSLPKKMVDAGLKMLEDYLKHPLAQVQTIREEMEFHWKLLDEPVEIVFEGKIDRIHREGDSLKVVDYKTGERRAESHLLQLGIYRLAMEEILGERGILTSNFYLSAGQEVPSDFSRAQLAEIRKGIIEDARKIAAGDFGIGDEKSKSRNCDSCDYAAFCESVET